MFHSQIHISIKVIYELSRLVGLFLVNRVFSKVKVGPSSDGTANI